MKKRCTLFLGILIFIFVFAFASSALAQTSDALWGSQLVVGGGWSTDLVLTNNGSTGFTGYVGFLRTLRSPSGVPTWGFFRPTVGGAQVNSAAIPVSVAVGETKSFHIENPEFVAGWLFATRECCDSLVGLSGELVRRYGASEYRSALVTAGTSFKVPAEFSASGATGVAITNVNYMPFYRPNVELRAVDESGVLAARTTILARDIPPGVQLAKFIFEYFASNPDWQNYLASHGGTFKGNLEIEAIGWPISIAAVLVKF